MFVSPLVPFRSLCTQTVLFVGTREEQRTCLNALRIKASFSGTPFDEHLCAMVPLEKASSKRVRGVMYMYHLSAPQNEDEVELTKTKDLLKPTDHLCGLCMGALDISPLPEVWKSGSYVDYILVANRSKRAVDSLHTLMHEYWDCSRNETFAFLEQNQVSSQNMMVIDMKKSQAAGYPRVSLLPISPDFVLHEGHVSYAPSPMNDILPKELPVFTRVHTRDNWSNIMSNLLILCEKRKTFEDLFTTMLANIGMSAARSINIDAHFDDDSKESNALACDFGARPKWLGTDGSFVPNAHFADYILVANKTPFIVSTLAMAMFDKWTLNANEITSLLDVYNVSPDNVLVIDRTRRTFKISSCLFRYDLNVFSDSDEEPEEEEDIPDLCSDSEQMPPLVSSDEDTEEPTVRVLVLSLPKKEESKPRSMCSKPWIGLVLCLLWLLAILLLGACLSIDSTSFALL